MKKTTYYLLANLLAFMPLWAAPYTDNGDTITDTRTGLVWQKCSNGQSGASCGTGSATTATWTAAITYCNNLNLAGKTWRLPSKNELLSITERSKYSPAIDTTYFPATVSSSYWSSSTYASGTASAWGVYFNYGYSSYFSKPNNYYVRCVAGP